MTITVAGISLLPSARALLSIPIRADLGCRSPLQIRSLPSRPEPGQERIQRGQVLLSSADPEQCQELPLTDFFAVAPPVQHGAVLHVGGGLVFHLVCAGSVPGRSPSPQCQLPVPPRRWLPGQTHTEKTRLVSRSPALSFLVRPVPGPLPWLWLQTKQQSGAKELRTKGFYLLVINVVQLNQSEIISS